MARRAPRRSKAHREFVAEGEEILERMRADLADLGEARARGEDADPALVNGLFRSAHSLKGLSGLFGFDALGELAHRAEDLLDGLRLSRVRLDSPALPLLDEAVALFAGALRELPSADVAPDLEGSVRELVARIERACGAAPDASLEALPIDPALLRALTEYEEHRLRENLRRGRRLLCVELGFDLASFEEGLREANAAIAEVGEVISTLPSPGVAAQPQIRFSLLVASGLAARELAVRLELAEPAVRELVAAGAPPATEAAAVPGPAPEVGLEAALPGEGESLRSQSDTVRVDVRKLDELMNLVGELVLQRGALESIAQRLAQEPGTARLAVELHKLHRTLDRKLQDLQAGVLDVRMVPLRQVFERLSRVARRLRRDLDKDVRLEIRGADTELDKLIVEELVDPLMHLVRNAFDHAIETAPERLAAGKPEQGEIRIEASQRGNHVVIVVADDGRGIDAARVRARAEASGLVRAEEALSPAETLALVFAPGFSTRDGVTETSGRGVGLDVVRANVAALGGAVELDSEPGRGTRFTLTLPITLAIIQALVVGAGSQRFAIPLGAVQETLVVEPGAIQRSEGRELLSLRGEALVLRRLADVFDLAAPEPGARQFAVVVGLGESRAGLLVDRLDGQQDAVLKPLQGPLAAVSGIAGATELGDQQAVLVLDVAALVDDGLRRREAA
jgi:two-component system chemotaxis sensor kinase CheA